MATKAQNIGESANRRRYDPTETRSRILEAAYLLFATRGFAGTGTADIAQRADVSEGSIFYHFGSKLALLIELGKNHGQKLVGAMQGDDQLGNLPFEVSLNRCFDFFEERMQEEEAASACAAPVASTKALHENEPFFQASKEIVVGWTRAHLEALAERHGISGLDTEIAASLVFAAVGEAVHQYFAADSSPEWRQRIRAEAIRFCKAALDGCCGSAG